MEYKRTEKYNIDLVNEKIMGPNPLKLEEELMKDNTIKSGSLVMDLKYMQQTFGVIQKKIKNFLMKWD